MHRYIVQTSLPGCLPEREPVLLEPDPCSHHVPQLLAYVRGCVERIVSELDDATDEWDALLAEIRADIDRASDLDRGSDRGDRMSAHRVAMLNLLAVGEIELAAQHAGSDWLRGEIEFGNIVEQLEAGDMATVAAYETAIERADSFLRTLRNIRNLPEREKNP